MKNMEIKFFIVKKIVYSVQLSIQDIGINFMVAGFLTKRLSTKGLLWVYIIGTYKFNVWLSFYPFINFLVDLFKAW